MSMTQQGPLVAVVGAGHWGRNLVRNFNRLGRLKYVLDQDPQARAGIAAEHPGVTLADDLEAILADAEIGAVVLASPAATHYRLARRVLDSGRHAFVEKPLALSLAEGRELVELAEARGLVLMVDHLMQGHAAYLHLRRLVEKGELGRLRHIHSRRLSFGRLRTEEDVWWSFAPHDLSMILGLAGREPETVAVDGESWLMPGLADGAEARLDFGLGLTARISVNWLNPVKEQRLVVIGEHKSAVLDDTLPWPEKLKLFAHRVQWPGGRPQAAAGEAEAAAFEPSEPLAAQVAAFLSAIDGGPRPVADGREGLRVLASLEAGARSMAAGGRPESPGPARDFFLHPTSEVDAGAVVGQGCRIWHFSHVLAGSEIGENCNIGQNVVIGPKVKIGRGVKIQNNVSVYEGVTLEDDVFCGPSMVFTNVVNPRSDVARKNEYRPTLVGRGATIGANATIVCGHRLGPWSFIGAGAVVTGDVPAHALMLGNPARRRGWMCRCGVKLPESLVCGGCGRAYRPKDEGLEQLQEEGAK